MSDIPEQREVRAEPQAPEAGRYDAFISYAREDGVLAERLAAALQTHGKAVWLDVKGIVAGEEWDLRIRRAIEACKAFVFVLSGDAVRSMPCRHEVDHATALNKLIIPIYHREFDEEECPEALRKREWILLGDRDSFEAGIGRLVEALETDVEWRDQHTRLAGRGREWRDANEDKSFLLRGSDLRDAENWLTRQADHREAATGDQIEYILRSRRAASARQRALTAGVGAGLFVAMVLAAFALIQRNEAIEREHEARSRELAANATNAMATDPGLGLALAVLAVDTARTTQATVVLRQATLAVRTLEIRRLHRGAVNAVAVDRDGRRVVTAGHDGTVRVWKPREAHATEDIGGHAGGPVYAAAISLDGRHVGSVGADLAVVVSDPTGANRRVVLRRAGVDVAFSRDGRRIAVAGTDGTVSIRRADGRGPVTVLRGHRGVVYQVAFSPNGRDVLTSGADGTVRVRRVDGHGHVNVMHRRDAVQSVDFSPDGRRVVVADDGGRVQVWSAANGRSVARLPRQENPVWTARFSRDGHRILTGGPDGVVRVWDFVGKNVLVVLRGHRGRVQDAAFLPGGRIVSADQTGIVRLWDPGAGLVLRGQVSNARFSRAGAHVISWSRDGWVRIWRLRDQRVETAVRGDRGGLFAADLSPDGRHFLSAGRDGAIRVWRRRQRTVQAVLRGHEGRVNHATFSSDGSRIVSAGEDGSVRVWPSGGGRSRIVGRHDRPVSHTEISRDGRLVASSSINGVVRIWRSDRTGPPYATLRGHDGDVRSVTFSWRGNRVATVGVDRTVRVWTPHGRPLAVLRGHEGSVNAVAFRPDGRRLVTGGDDRQVKVWDPAGGEALVTLREHGRGVFGVQFSPDGHDVLSAAGDRRIRIAACEVCGSLLEVLAAARGRAIRALAPAERQRILGKAP